VPNLTAAAALAQLEGEIAFGEIAAQHAPGGHPLFAALDNARELQGYIQDNAAVIPPSGLPDTSRLALQVAQAIEAIDAAAATLRNDPDQPLPKTIWPQLPDLPWPWITAGLAGVVLVAVLFQQRRA
jgi:hypothetical protein